MLPLHAGQGESFTKSPACSVTTILEFSSASRHYKTTPDLEVSEGYPSGGWRRGEACFFSGLTPAEHLTGSAKKPWS
jgi:hypothetical protein